MKTATEFPIILDSFSRFILAPLHQASLTMGGGGRGMRVRVYYQQNELGRCNGKISLAMSYWWLKTL